MLSLTLSLLSWLQCWGAFPRTPLGQAWCRYNSVKQSLSPKTPPWYPVGCSTSTVGWKQKTSLCLHMYSVVMLQVQSHLPAGSRDPYHVQGHQDAVAGARCSPYSSSPNTPTCPSPPRGSPQGSRSPPPGLIRIQLMRPGLIEKCQFGEDNCLIKI